MKIIAINGSPRKTWNTATLLRHALDGAASHGTETELVHLYDLTFKGCTSCFSCKLKNGVSYGRCAVKDDLTDLLQRIETCDGLIFGSPVYLGEVTGEMRSFYERLIYPYLVYNKEHASLFPKRIGTGFIYTMNADEARLKNDYQRHFSMMRKLADHFLGKSESLYVTDTKQFDDYSKYVSDLFDSKAKCRRHEDVFPADCGKAYELGAHLAEQSLAVTD